MLINYNRSLKIVSSYKVFISNVLSLGLIQVSNLLLPIITIPYLLRVIGIENYGLLAFAGSLISYLMIFVDFGFNISATKHISINRFDTVELNKIFNSVYIIKLILLIVSFLLFSVIIFSFEKFRQESELYFISYLLVCGQFFFPVWFYQGVEQLKYISIVHLVTKLFFTISIFLLVKKPSDYLLVPFLTSLGYIITGIYSIYKIKKKYSIIFKLQKFSILKFYFIDSLYIFSSNLFISLYTSSNIFMLGIFGNNKILGEYVIVDKIIVIFKNLYMPISQSLFPLLSLKFKIDKINTFLFLNKISKFLVPLMLFFSTLIFILSKPLILFISGKYIWESIKLLKIMAILPFLITLSNLTAIQGLYNLGKSALVNNYILIVAIIHIITLPYLITNFGNLGLTVMSLFTEFIITILSIYFYKNEYKKYNINFF